ncbi:hypothetical protein H6G89_19735 [Oscillatoria sp. FACHB-1407]|uniref:hypothetical protein n=1 Tax=Oscillatoria sp. FACHB-1407 TaxID=2692847 RepID=UPI001685F3DE|nr:hypothetical protein [Oscillatoria sp. FACHB-1407]MBD2463270.1 hypothetical protein [Oscillatoria sp. FACHB-1407]
MTRKRLLTGARQSSTRSRSTQSRLCVVITFEDGIRAQYPVENESEAIALLAHYTQLNPSLQTEVAMG